MEMEEEMTGRRKEGEGRHGRGMERSLLSPSLGGINLGEGERRVEESARSGLLSRPQGPSPRLSSIDWMTDDNVDLSQGIGSTFANDTDLEMNFSQSGNELNKNTTTSSQRWWDGEGLEAMRQSQDGPPTAADFWQDDILPDDDDALMDLGQLGQLGTRRAYADMASDESEQRGKYAPENHVDSKPRLGDSSSDEAPAHLKFFNTATTTTRGRSETRTKDRGTVPSRRRIHENDSLSSDANGQANTNIDDTSLALGEDIEDSGGRDHSPLSRALKFLYSAASPKVNSADSWRIGNSRSDSDTSQREQQLSNSSSARLEQSSGEKDKLMSDTSIWRTAGLDTDTSSSPDQQNTTSNHDLLQRRQAPVQRQDHIVSSASHHRTSSTRSRNPRIRHRGRAYQSYADVDVGECYSDVEAEYNSSDSLPMSGTSYEKPLDPAQPLAQYNLHWSADAKRPAYDGDDTKRTQEAKEIAENALLDAIHRREAKLEAKQEAPEYMQYSTAPLIGTPDVKTDRDSPSGLFWAGQAITTLPASVDASECLPEPGHDQSFFAPYVVVYRTYDDNHNAYQGRRQSIVRCGASFALEELPAPSGDRDEMSQEERTETDRRKRAQVEADIRDKDVEALKRSAPRGIVVLGGGEAAPSALMPFGEAARLIAFHDDPDGESSAEEQEAAKHDLQELIAQKSARKPPRRSARPLAPAGVELTPEERIALERERNREHARNTRLRKKAALANLKETVVKITAKCRQADQDALERRARGSVKRACIEAFFRFRARAERDRERWAQVVTDDVELWQPVTSHRSFRPAELLNDKTRRLSKGVDALVEDAASLAVLFRSIGRRGAAAAKFDRAPRFVFEATIASRDQSEAAITDAFTASDTVGMHWCMRTLDALDFGVDREVAKNGMLLAKFDKVSCKIKYIEFMYDEQAFATQIQRALKLDSPPFISNLYEEENVHEHDDARVVTSATKPHIIENCNAALMNLCGATRKEDVLGHTLSCIQGDLTDEQRLAELFHHVENGRCADALLVNYRLTGEPFLNYLRVFPLFSNEALNDPRVPPTHYLGILRDVINTDEERRRYHYQQYQKQWPPVHGVVHNDPEWNAAVAAAVIASTPTGIAAQLRHQKRHEHYHATDHHQEQQQPPPFPAAGLADTRTLGYNRIAPNTFPEQQGPTDVVPPYTEYGQVIPPPPQYNDPRVWNYQQGPPRVQ